MGSAACFNINILDIYNPDCVSRYDTSLIKVEAVFLFSFRLIFEVFVDWMAF
jgi:hypothetical protein